MYVNDIDTEMRKFISNKMCTLLKECIEFSTGDFDPEIHNNATSSTFDVNIGSDDNDIEQDVFDAINQNQPESNDYDATDDHTYNNTNSFIWQGNSNDDDVQSNESHNEYDNFFLTLPKNDNRRKDERIRYAHER